MRRIWTGRAATALFAALTAVAQYAGYRLASASRVPDPDRWYHLALARYQSTSDWLPRSLPQVVGLGWDQYFPDKEFLFHQVTALAHSIGGEPLVEALVPALGVLVALLVFVAARLFVRAPWAFLVTAGICVLSPYFGYRTSLLRAHVLAMSFFVLVFLGLKRRSRLAVFAGCALFALTYHGLYVPVLLLLVMSAAAWRSEEQWKLAAAGLVGLASGTIVNPYFPSNLVMMARTFSIAWNDVSATKLAFGAELIPLPTDMFLSIHQVPFAVLAIAIVHLVWLSRRWAGMPGEQRGELLEYGAVALATAAFWGLSAKSPRGAEYAIPLTAVLLAAGLRQAPRPRLAIPSTLLAMTVLQVAVNLPRVGEGSARHALLATTDGSQAMRRLLEVIPQDREAALFNCNWFDTPFVFYDRPKLRFLDILDPTLLAQAAPELHQAREALTHGVPDPYLTIRGLFHSDYALCAGGSLGEQLEADPHFVRIAPRPPLPPNRDASLVPNLYAVASAPEPSFVEEYEVSLPMQVTDTRRYLELAPSAATGWSALAPRQAHGISERAASFSHLLTTGASTPASVVCVAVRPSRKAIQSHPGASILGLGGDHDIRVWWNGKPLFASGAPFESRRLVSQLVRLPRSLTDEDRLEAIVCSPAQDTVLELVLSLWRQERLDALCQAKGWASPGELDRALWPYRGLPAQTCLGPMAVPLDGVLSQVSGGP